MLKARGETQVALSNGAFYARLDTINTSSALHPGDDTRKQNYKRINLSISNLWINISRAFRRRSRSVSHAGLAAMVATSLMAGVFAVPVHISKSSGSVVTNTQVKLANASRDQVTLTLSEITDQAVAADLAELNEKDVSPSLPLAATSTFGNASPILPSHADGLRGDIVRYTIKKGDTISAIAQSFSITTDTVLQSNEINDPFSVKPGQKILILPVSGVLHTAKANETVESIAGKYKANKEQIFAINDIDPVSIKEGAKLIIPGGVTKLAIKQHAVGATTARFVQGFGKGMFIKPASARCANGYHWYAIDCPGSYGQAVWASAAGRVVTAIRSCPGNYSVYSGFCAQGGNLVVIDHGNGYQTRYAHNSSVYVSPGQYVGKGQVIAGMGCSGVTRGGANGRCAIHVHFAITRNGVRYNPFRFL